MREEEKCIHTHTHKHKDTHDKHTEHTQTHKLGKHETKKEGGFFSWRVSKEQDRSLAKVQVFISS